MQSISVPFDGSVQQLAVDTPITLRAKIPRYASMLGPVFLVLNLPDIYSPIYMGGLEPDAIEAQGAPYEFQWVRDIGSVIIQSARVIVGGNEIQRMTGEYMHILSTTDLPENKRRIYDRMTGNRREFFNPAQGRYMDYMTISQSTYPNAIPSGDESCLESPSIPGDQLVIPLQFWFCKHSAAAVPLCALQKHTMEIEITLRPLRDLYTILEVRDMSLRPNRPQRGTRIRPEAVAEHAMNNFLQSPTQFAANSGVGGPDNWNLEPRLECEYIFLEDREEKLFAGTSHRYLIKQVNHIEVDGVVSEQKLDIKQHNLVTRIFWTLRRSDFRDKNLWTNYTNWQNPELVPRREFVLEERFPAPILTTYVSNSGIFRTDTQYLPITTSTIFLDGERLFDPKDAWFFNWLQPYAHATSSSVDGIYQYSFALNNTEYQPSGSINMSMFNKIQLHIVPIVPPATSITAGGITVAQYNYTYLLDIHIESYNFFVIMGGLGGLAFAL